MMRGWHTIAVAVILAALGVGLMVYKVVVLRFPLQPDAASTVWTVQARVSFETRGSRVLAEFRLPSQPPGFTILEETFVSRGFGLETVEEESGRFARWARRDVTGAPALYYRALVVADGSRAPNPQPPPFPSEPHLEEPYRTALRTLVATARSESADVSTFTSALLRHLNRNSPTAEVALFLGEDASAATRAETAVMLLAGNRIPARVAYGIDLEERKRRANFSPWLEVHDGERWLFFDPGSGQQGLAPHVLVWWHGPEDLITVRGAGNPEVAISVQPTVEQQMTLAERRAELSGSRVVEFSPLSLPLQTQAVYRVILLIPIGALVMVLLRNVVGIKTFGIFTPVLVALAFRETRLFWGVVLFVLVITLGLTLRAYLDRLRLLLVPRLAAVLTLVVLVMVSLSILSHRLGVETGLSVALFPLVILTMAIERLSIVWEERGPWEAIQEALGSLLVAALAYLVMGLEQVAHLVFVFPESLLVVLAMMIGLGRYRGYRLLELLRFRTLAGGGP